MRTLFKTLGLAALFLASSSALAADAAKSADADEATSSPHKLDLGFGLFNAQLQANAEYVTDSWGNFVFRVGKLKDKGNLLLPQVAWRTPIQAASGHDSGYYVGAFAGDLDQAGIGGHPRRLIGAGVDLGYHWVGDNTRSVVSVGLGGTQEKQNAEGVNQGIAPTLFLNFSIAGGFF